MESIKFDQNNLNSSEKQERIRKKKNFYEILDVRVTAERIDIREAYVRLKKTYSSHNQALYSFMSEDDSKQILQEIEEAFRTLDDDLLRADYDKSLLNSNPNDKLENSERIDFYENKATYQYPKDGDPFNRSPFENRSISRPLTEVNPINTHPNRLKHGAISNTFEVSHESSNDKYSSHFIPKKYPPIEKVARKAKAEEFREQMKELIEKSDNGNGLLYKQIRELLEISRDEIQRKTKISPEYVVAIEENAFQKLPAPVYVKGFVKSYLEYLGVTEAEEIAGVFIERLRKWQKTKKL